MNLGPGGAVAGLARPGRSHATVFAVIAPFPGERRFRIACKEGTVLLAELPLLRDAFSAVLPGGEGALPLLRLIFGWNRQLAVFFFRYRINWPRQLRSAVSIFEIDIWSRLEQPYRQHIETTFTT